MIDRDKVVFINLTEMEFYNGPEENISRGGDYVNKNGYGHELFNFKKDNGFRYGYAPPKSNINIKKIAPDEIQNNDLGKYIDNVLVIFTAASQERPGAGRFIVGYYKNARVYEKNILSNSDSRFIADAKDGVSYASYNLVCKEPDAILIPKKSRNETVPNANQAGFGYGQYPVWYALGKKTGEKQKRNEILDYIEKYDKDEALRNKG